MSVLVREGYVPVIDLQLSSADERAPRIEVAQAVADAFANSGFMVVTGHGVPEDIVSNMYTNARKFFDQPSDFKEEVQRDPMDILQRGYGRNDSKLEMYSASVLGEAQAARLAFDNDVWPGPRNQWPAMPGFREAYLAYYEAVSIVADEIMRLCALALGLDENWFLDKFQAPMTPLSVNHYFAMNRVPLGEEDGLRNRAREDFVFAMNRVPLGEEDGLRNRAHEDFVTLTVLYQDDAPGGLQILDKSGNWIGVPPIPGTFVINIGDMMQLWTNDRWSSTVHRVINPPEGDGDKDRISIAYFLQPGPDELIDCVPTCVSEQNPARYKPVTSGDFFLGKARRAIMRARTKSRT